MKANKSEDQKGKQKAELKLENKQLRNEIEILKQEKDEALGKYYELYQNIEKKVEERAKRIKEKNRLLEEEIKNRKQTEQELENALQEKEELLHEVHHRVKNNMQLVSSLLSLHMKEVDNIKAQNILLESKNRLNSIALVHELFYNCDQLSEIQIDRYIRKLIPILVKTHGLEDIIDVNYNVVNKVVLGLRRSVPLALVINEVISNIINDDGRDIKGKIQINIETEEDSFILKIEQSHSNLTSDKIDDPQDRSFGGYLISILVEQQLGGVFERKSTNGTLMKIVFPLKK